MLNYTEGVRFEGATASISCSRSAIDAIVLGQVTLADQIDRGAIVVDGDAQAFTNFLGMLDDFEFWFDIVTP